MSFTASHLSLSGVASALLTACYRTGPAKSCLIQTPTAGYLNLLLPHRQSRRTSCRLSPVMKSQRVCGSRFLLRETCGLHRPSLVEQLAVLVAPTLLGKTQATPKIVKLRRKPLRDCRHRCAMDRGNFRPPVPLLASTPIAAFLPCQPAIARCDNSGLWSRHFDGTALRRGNGIDATT